MGKLNELVELAKKAISGEWYAFISTGGDGTFSIHTSDDSRKGDVVNWPGFDTASCSKAQKKANAKYIAAANPATILTIAEAFRALEQRAEAAEAKLAELEKQEAVAEVNHDGTFYGFKALENMPEGKYELFTRPAPAVCLAELVPEEFIKCLAALAAAISLLENGSKKAAPSNKMFDQMINDYRKALESGRNILRNIEEAK